MTADLQGSWFPTGYYGHFRSKSRPDFICEYRQLARPQPPQKFYRRSQEPTRKHVFSHHDNRQAFLNDALIFQQGLGKRRVENSTYNFKNDFIAWMPEREFVERSRPLASTYRVDFMEKDSKKQLLTHRPKTSFDGVPTTSYRYSHGEHAPNKKMIDAMNNQALKLSLLNRKDRAMSAISRGRESVASCLTWVSANTERKPAPVQQESVKPVVPLATQTSNFIPHPPSEPKQQQQMPDWPAPSSPLQRETTTLSNPPPQQTSAPPQCMQAPPPVAQAPPPQQLQPMAE